MTNGIINNTTGIKAGDRVGIVDAHRTHVLTVTKVSKGGQVTVEVAAGTVYRIFNKHGQEMGKSYGDRGLLVTVERAEEIIARKEAQRRVDKAVDALKNALDNRRAGNGHYTGIPAHMAAELEALAAKLEAIEN